MAEMLVCIIIAHLAGQQSTLTAVHWCKTHEDQLRSYGLVLANGVASYDTHQRMLREIETEPFSLQFIAWSNEILAPINLQLAIDGKALCGATDRRTKEKTPYMLNILERRTRLIVASIPIDSKTNEIKAIPQALALIGIAKNIFTIDAIGTYVPIIDQIVSEDGDFILTVKKNNPEAYKSLMDFFEKRRTEMKEQLEKEMEAKLHNMKSTLRPEENYYYENTGWQCEKAGCAYAYRKCEVIHTPYDDSCFSSGFGAMALSPDSALGKQACCFQTIGIYSTVRIPIDYDENGKDVTPPLKEFLEHGSKKVPTPKVGDSEKDDVQHVGVIAHGLYSAEEMLQRKKGHWSVESMHQSLDVSQREDFSVGKDSKYNASLLRKLAHNLVKLAEYWGEARDENSFHVKGIYLINDSDLMHKLLFNKLPVIRFDAA